jgi:hypothetical protein
MSEYTPSQGDVELGYVERAEQVSGTAHFAAGLEFDRWLALVKADAYRTGYNKATADIVDEERSLKAKADAWDEGCDVGWDEKGIGPDPVNPYRGEQA